MANMISRRFISRLRWRLLNSSERLSGVGLWSKALGVCLMVVVYAGLVGAVSYEMLDSGSLVIAMVGF